MSRTLLMLSLLMLIVGSLSFLKYQQEFVLHHTGGTPVEVLVAARDIPIGEPVRDEWLSTRSIPRSYVEERHIPVSSRREVIGLPLSQSVRAGEAILRTDVSALSNASRTLASVIPPGLRAQNVMVSQYSTFGGLLRPGDHVDAILSVGLDPYQARATVLFENLLVLAVTGLMNEAPSENPLMRVRNGGVTLEVTVEQSAAFATAVRGGDVILILRSPHDIETEPQRADIVLDDLLTRERWARYQHRSVVEYSGPPPTL